MADEETLLDYDDDENEAVENDKVKENKKYKIKLWSKINIIFTIF